MAAREAAFSDPEVKSLLESRFVPIAENCSYLQRQQDAEGDLFRLLAEQGHYGGRFQPTDTRQGMYVGTPDGELLASCNVHGADRLLPVLHAALHKWEAPDRVAAAVAADGGAPDARFRRRPPEGGLVLRVWVRDLPRDPSVDTRREDWRRRAFNLDHAWFRPEEAAALIPPDPKVGDEMPWPAGLARRLARYHFIDNVRGETPMWRPEQVEVAEVRTRVIAVEGGRVEAAFEGEARMGAHDAWVEDFSRESRESDHRIEVRLRGTGTWLPDSARFAHFELSAVGTRAGATKYNSRHDDPGPAPIGYALELAGPSGGVAMVGDATPPQGIWMDYFGGR